MDEDEKFDFKVSLVLVLLVSVWCLVPGLLTVMLTPFVGLPIKYLYIFATSRVGMLCIAAAAGYFFALSGRPRADPAANKSVEAKKSE